jgi:regulator of protease activity HflC (stomatin/prohibitin superfamily)
MEGIEDSFYKLNNPERQIQSYVFDSIRSEVPKMELDAVFAEKDKIAIAVKNELS